MTLTPGPWQRDAVNRLTGRLSHPLQRAALLQLPTGFGKSLVAVEVFERLRRNTPSLRLVIVLPRESVTKGWRRALCLPEGDHIGTHEWLSKPNAKVRFETRLKLANAALRVRPGRLSQLASLLHAAPTLVVVDEIHRHRRLLASMASTFDDVDAEGGLLTKPFRRPRHGRRCWPKWLLLSATPFNPVSLDWLDIDTPGTNDELDNAEKKEEAALLDEVQRTLGALAQLSGLDHGEWFDDHVKTVRTRLSSNGVSAPFVPPAQMAIWPTTIRQNEFKPDAPARFIVSRPSFDPTRHQNALRELIDVATSLTGKADTQVRRATGERFVLSGGPLTVSGSSIQGQPDYGPALRRSVEIASASLKKRLAEPKHAGPAKLESLLRFLSSDVQPKKPQNILIFCVHRAVAKAVADALVDTFPAPQPKAVVRTAIGHLEDKDGRWFSGKTDNGWRMLVATDACSESIDLHETANLLVHYELPWSPLRVLQRVGRLWRILPDEATAQLVPRPPALPGIVHFAHPGSTDEEILSRLRRRWCHLSVLGLDYLSYDEALGPRLPAVPWPKTDPGGQASRA